MLSFVVTSHSLYKFKVIKIIRKCCNFIYICLDEIQEKDFGLMLALLTLSKTEASVPAAGSV